MDQRLYTILGLLVFALAAILRFYNLGATELWLDEAIYANNSTGSFGEFLDNTRTVNSSPIVLPLLYFIFGDAIRDPFWIRVPPALFSLSAVLVLLVLPRVGVARPVALIAAGICAISSTQIQYAQEVREYSLGVLVGSLCLYAFFAYLERRRILPMILVAFSAPLMSYGTVFLVVAFGMVVTAVSVKRGDWTKPLAAGAAFVFGCVASYLLTARYQFGVSSAWYLQGAYPPDGGSAADYFFWLTSSVYSAVAFGVGDVYVMLALGIALVVWQWRQTKDLHRARPEYLAFWSMFVLLFVQIAASAVGAYPFGGIRQIIYMTPLVYFCIAIILADLIVDAKRNRLGLLAGVLALALFAANSASTLPKAYSELQNPVALLKDNVRDQDMTSVYVYYGAVPAVRFHMPDFPGTFGTHLRDQKPELVQDILAANLPCERWLLFSHDPFNEQAYVIAELAKNGFTNPRAIWGTNAVLYEYDNCRSE